jgi:protein KRI1
LCPNLNHKMSSKPLFDDDSSSADDDKVEENDHRIRVNQKFAKDYQTKKQLEELRNAAANNDDDDDDSSDDESEDEDGELLTPHLNVSILKTINALRNKEKSIYDPSAKFFHDPADKEAPNEMNSNSATEKSKKKKHFKDVLREQILDQMDDDEKEGVKDVSQNRKGVSTARLEYDEEQKELRSAFHANDDGGGSGDDDDEDEDILVVKKRAEPVLDEDLEKEYEVLQKTTTKGELKDPRGEVQDADTFLLDFLKNRKWVDKDLDANSDDDDNEPKRKNNIIGINDDDDSIDDVDRADEFESKFNFRFEEAQTEIKSGADFSVVGYARSGTMDTLRRKDDTRRQKRLERQERKAAERKAKEEQLRRLKNAKRHEMDMKLNEIKKVIGSVHDVDEDALMKLMEGDYDPEKFEKLMQDTYGDDFYEKEETQWKSDLDVRESLLQDEDGKMLVGEDDVDGGLYDGVEDDDADKEYNGEEDDADKEYNGEEDDADVEYYGEDDDAVEGDYDDEILLPAGSAVEQKLKTKLQEELYKLDYEDIVAGMPTRFKYRKVEPNDFGLATHEILMARDATLRNLVSLKKIAPYRDDGEYAVGHKKRRRFREMLKDDLKQMADEAGIVEREEKQVVDENEDEKDDNDTGGKKKRRRQKKGKKKTHAGDDIDTPAVVDEDMSPEIADEEGLKDGESGKKKRRKQKNKAGQDAGMESSENDTLGRREVAQTRKESSAGDVKAPKVDTTAPMAVGKTEAKVSRKKSEKRTRNEETIDKKPNRKKTKKSTIEGVSASRLKAYGL